MKISVVIPLYNKSNTITETINSVLSQTFLPDEVIIINDGSTDGSAQLVASLNIPIIKIFYQENKGVSYTRNKGVEIARNDWIAFLDADDLWLPQYLETIKILHAKFPECKVIASSYFIQNKTGNRREIVLNRIPFKGEYGKLYNYFEVSSFSHPPVWSSSMVVEKSALNRIGGFPHGIKSGEDLLTWAKLAIEYEIAYSKKPFSVFVQNTVQSLNGIPTRSPQEPDLVGDELTKLAENHPEIPDMKRYISHWFKMRASVFMRLGLKRKACSEALKSLSYNPLNFKILIYILLLLLPVSSINKVFIRLGNS